MSVGLQRQTVEPNVVWEPIPSKIDGYPSSQQLALSCPADIIFFDGARGPGKTAAQYMDFRQYVGKGYGKYWRGIIFDKEQDNLGDLVAQTQREFPLFDDGATFKKASGDYRWVWPTGEELLLRHVKNIEDYDGFHGWEIPFIGWNEITKYATRGLYDKFMSINRSSFEPEKHTPKVEQGNKLVYATPDGKPLPPIPLKVFVTTNPNGPGHNWCKEEFVDPAPPGVPVIKRTELRDDLTGETRIIEKSQVRIFGNFFENPYLPDEYRATIMEACDRDPNLYEAWIKGNWDVNAGGVFDDLWKSDVHIMDRFMVPKHWKVDRAFDWGSTTPFWTGWFAEANGEPCTLLNGIKWNPPRGTLILIDEDYGCYKLGSNEGLKLSVEEVANRIKKHQQNMKDEMWVLGRFRAGPADNQIRNVNLVTNDTIEDEFATEGIQWEESDKNPGSRKIGVQLMRNRLRAAVVAKTVGYAERPAFYVTRNCKATIKILPNLSRDPDDMDDVHKEGEDHPWDGIRYRLLKASNRYAQNVKATWGQ